MKCVIINHFKRRRDILPFIFLSGMFCHCSLSVCRLDMHTRSPTPPHAQGQQQLLREVSSPCYGWSCLSLPATADLLQLFSNRDCYSGMSYKFYRNEIFLKKFLHINLLICSHIWIFMALVTTFAQNQFSTLQAWPYNASFPKYSCHQIMSFFWCCCSFFWFSSSPR